MTKKLTNYQVKILESILDYDVISISYRKPEMQLGNFVKDKTSYETSEALRSLEKDFGVLSLNPKLRFGLFNKCGYSVKLDEVRKLYESYVKEK